MSTFRVSYEGRPMARDGTRRFYTPNGPTTRSGWSRPCITESEPSLPFREVEDVPDTSLITVTVLWTLQNSALFLIRCIV